MQAEFVTVPAAAARTYNVPAAVVAAITTALEDPQNQNHHDAAFGDRLAVTGKAVLDDIVRIHTAADDGADGIRGGSAGRAWAARIADGITREFERVQDERLARYEYDDATYAYTGITAAGNEDLITHIVRFPIDDENLQRSEALTASGWFPVEFDFDGDDRDVYGVGLDRELFAFTASALLEDDDVTGVLLAYGQPLCFLEEQPLLASAPALDADKPGHVYAIVDATDTTAVMDLIMMRKDHGNPTVYRRNGGKWTLDPGLLEAFMSPAPPPIVELTGLHRNQIIAQVDSANANQVMSQAKDTPGDDGQAIVGPNATTATKPGEAGKPPTPNDGKDSNVKLGGKGKTDPKPPGAPADPENREKRTPNDAEEGPNSRPPVTAAAITADYEAAVARANTAHSRLIKAASDHYYSDEGYAQGYSLVAALRTADDVHEHALLEARELATMSTLEAIEDIRAIMAQRDRVIIPGLTAASGKPKNAPTQNNSPNQRKAEELRKYWLRGKGAVKIRWGTSGDWRRCERQLRKYMGHRAKGYCARRHREAVGYFPGDKRNK